jgi:serine/threonine-protein kinase
MPPERVVWVLGQALRSLAEAHEQGLVHRDIKPANLMLCRHGGEHDFVKVLDFGLVKAPVAGGASSPNITRELAVMGTAAYFAPESAAGSKRVDARADLYALACVGFWLLTGRLVFDKTAIMEMIRAHTMDPPPRASSMAERAIPPELDLLIDECLAKKPDDRPASAHAILARLDAIPLKSPWTLERAR